MPSNRLFSAPDLARLPITVNLREISLAEGLRAGLAVVAIIALGEYFLIQPLREAALAALLTCICDPGGPISRRLPILISFTFAGAAVTASFGLARALGPAVALPLGIFGIFCCSFARIYGQAPQQLGGLLCTVQILALDRGDTSFAEAGIIGLAFIGGSLWAILLALVLWRIHPFLPVRRAVSDAYRVLSDLVRDLEALSRAPGVSDAAWDAHARIHRRATRDSLEAARTVLLDTLRARGPGSNRAAQALIRLETADQIFGALIALSDAMERGTPADRNAVRNILRRIRSVLVTLGRGIVTDEANAAVRISRVIDAVAADKATLPANGVLAEIVDQIVERLRIATTLAVPANLAPGIDAAGRAPPIGQRIAQPVRANLTWKSPALRHALRTSVTAGLPLAFTMAWFNPYDHWLTITVVATMQPYFALTYTRAIERIGGTMIGGILAAGIGLVCTTPVSVAAGMLILAIAAFALRTVSFGLFMMGLTPLVVLLVETGSPDTGGWMIALARAAFTAIGGVIAVGANFLLWPSREPDLVAAELRSAIKSHAAYADASFAVLCDGGAHRDLELARRAAGVATNTLEALITRALLEPRANKRELLETALVIDAALRRCAGRLTTLQHDHGVSAVISPADLQAWRSWTAGSLARSADGNNLLSPRPAGPQPDALGRLARQIELINGAMRRL